MIKRNAVLIKSLTLILLCCIVVLISTSCDLLKLIIQMGKITVSISSLSSSVKVNESATLSIKIVDSLGNTNIIEWSYKVSV